ncbi:ATP-dependent RNA helicase mss116 [Paracoccidioides lutzii Pb01]|uniref:ATP-dependent RNA helicase n=1 Tax=Paracoccidioides lutzii (strain ATCC MYA-826 / Pb01) TaxID=502779 RepID=C1GUH8_PARBA|nr:ATP-dependent RNA helicase mss116 [Paracoccidioides lutzii Pb01]EEH39984.2 ATP-dependent RNA helicase mss116 [Paracoccidioides lutzii Pb01]
MLGPVRRGNILGRTIRPYIVRSLRIQTGTQQPIISSRIAQQPSVLAIRAFHPYPALRSSQAASAVKESEAPTEYTQFSELATDGLVSDNVIRVLTNKMNITTMTEVQRMTINATLNGSDVLAQAKTGTGKTLAFLIPVVQNILKDQQLAQRARNNRSRSNASDIRALIISPTRELAEQIAVEAKKLVSNTSVIVQTAVGGTRKREGLMRIQHEGCHILVGTPGRLIDIFSDPTSGVSAPKLSALVLDEADRLLDIGFAPDIQELQSYLPRRQDVDRQTLMFSATVPKEVMAMVRQTMKQDFTFVKTVKEDETPTHLAVPQKLVYLRGLENQLPAIFELAKQNVENHKNDPANVKPFKAIVYFNSTAEVGLARQAFSAMRYDLSSDSDHPLPDVQCYEMHSRLTQDQRTRFSGLFRKASSAILFSSDVTARGMDFPDVTHVIQIGVPRDRETYIHRLGRTARANKKGEGWIFTLPLESDNVRRQLRGLPIRSDSSSLLTASADMTTEDGHPPHVSDIFSKVKDGFKTVSIKQKSNAYAAYLGTLAQLRDKYEVVQCINQLATHGWGLRDPPAFSSVTAARLGYRNIPGLNVRNSVEEDDAPGSSNSRGSYGSINSYGSRDSYRSRGYSSNPGFSGGNRNSYGGGRNSNGDGRGFNGGGRGYFSGGRNSNGGGHGSFSGGRSFNGGGRGSFGGGRNFNGGGSGSFGGGRDSNRSFGGRVSNTRQNRGNPFDFDS